VAERPTDDTIALVGFLLGGDWLTADELRHGVKELGFRMPSIQWTVARLRSMVKEDAPRFESRRAQWGGDWSEYRVTSWARTGLSNQWKGVSSFVPSADFYAALDESLPHPASVPPGSKGEAT
jgi:hypothetical protein